MNGLFGEIIDGILEYLIDLITSVITDFFNALLGVE